MQRRVVLLSVALVLAIAGVLPLVTMLLRSLGGDGVLDFSAYRGLMGSTRQWTLLGHSLLLSSLTTVFALLAGVPLGLILGRTDVPLRRTFAVVLALPLLIPSYIMGVSWADFFGVEGLFSAFAGSSAASTAYQRLFGLPGCVLVLSSTFLPVVVLLTMLGSRMVQSRLEEAAKLVMKWPGVLRHVTLPLMMPGLSLAAMLVFLLTVGEYSVPNYFRYDVYPVESFVQFSAFYNTEVAIAAAIPLVLLTLLGLFVEWLFFRDALHKVSALPGQHHPEQIRLGRLRMPVAAAVGTVCVLVVALPLLVLMRQSLSFDSYAEAFARASDSLLRSFLYAVAGASLLTVIGFFAGYLVHTRALRFWRSVDTLTILLFSIPGTVIGISLVTLWNRPWSNFVYASAAIILLGYLAKYVALGSRIVAASLGQVSPAMEEAAQVSGVRWLARLRYIVVPLVGRGVLAAWLVSYVFCLRDTDITMMVYPPGSETLPVRTMTLMANGTPELIAALCIIMVIATVVPPGLLWLLSTIRPRESADGSH